MADASPHSIGVCVQCTENACAGSPGAGWAMGHRPRKTPVCNAGIYWQSRCGRAWRPGLRVGHDAQRGGGVVLGKPALCGPPERTRDGEGAQFSVYLVFVLGMMPLALLQGVAWPARCLEKWYGA